MVKTFGVNSDNDIYLGKDGNLVVLNDVQAVLTACENASYAQLGEMVLQVNQGIPNFQTIWVGTPNYATWEAYLRQSLLAVPGVVDVTALEITNSNNVMSYTATIKTIYGTGVISNG